MCQLDCEEEQLDDDVAVSFLPQDRDTLYNNDFKMKFEYGFREKVKAAKLRGGNGPKQPKSKREKTIINLGEGGAAAAGGDKKKLSHKDAKAKFNNKKGKNNDDSDSEE